MDNQVVRLGTSDLMVAAELSEAMLNEPPASADRLTDFLQDRRNIVLACLRASKPVGYLVAHQFFSLSGDRLVYLYDIEVQRDCRQQGIGRSLVEALLEICRSERVDSIWVGSSLENVAACSLWQRTGATRVSEQFVEFTFNI